MSEVSYIKLSELTKRVVDVIKNTFNDYYWIVAEISGHKFYANQDRHYFDFIEKVEEKTDPIAKISGVAWTSGSQQIKLFEEATGQQFTNGVQVLVKVKVEFHSSYGMKLTLFDIDHSYTLGNLEKQRRETLLKLVAENPEHIKKVGDEYITHNKQKQFQLAIQHIAIIGSPNSEGYVDFTHTINTNQFGYKFSIDIYQSAVQGAGAENELVDKLIAIFNSNKKYDAVVIIRGGGAKTDFVVFDTYKLARAVARFPIPIITGIGHHKDVSICDLMTHTSTKTPTKAAEFIISHNRKFDELLINAQKGIIIKVQQLISSANQKVNTANLSIINKSGLILNGQKDKMAVFDQIIVNKTKQILYTKKTNLLNLLSVLSTKPKIATANRLNEIGTLVSNLKLFTEKYFANKKGYVGHYQEVIKLMRPENILKKGFAIVSQKGKILKDATSIDAGSELTISMDQFEIQTKVLSKKQKDE